LERAAGASACPATFPKDLPGRIVAARDLLAELGEATADDFPRRFKGCPGRQGRSSSKAWPRWAWRSRRPRARRHGGAGACWG